MADKKIALNFFQLNPETENPDTDEHKEQLKSIGDIFTQLPTSFQSIHLSESRVSIYGNIEKNGSYYLGTLIRNQISSIPPSFDEAASKLTKLPLGDEQGLAYPTSFLYDPNVRIVMIESVRNGVSIGTFCSFLNKNFHNGDKVHPSLVINPAKISEFNNMTMITKFQVKIARIQSGTIFNSKKNTSIGQIIHSSDNTNTDTLDYALSVRKKSSSLNPSKIRNLVNSFLKYDDSKEVRKLIITGKEDEDSTSDTINFIDQKLEDFITVKKERLIESFDINDHYTKLLEVYSNHKSSLSVYKVKSNS